LSVSGSNFITLYSNCPHHLCATGRCDMKGNCLGPCAFSIPARNSSNCSCPTSYVDDGFNGQCQ
jgi:hypothetical protein